MTYIYLGNHILSPAVCVPGSRGVPESTVFYQGCHCPWGTLVFLQKSRFLIVTIVTQLQSIVFLLFNFTFFFSDLQFWTFNLILYLFIFPFSMKYRNYALLYIFLMFSKWKTNCFLITSAQSQLPFHMQ